MRTAGWLLLLLGLVGLSHPSPAQLASTTPAEWSTLTTPAGSNESTGRPTDIALSHVIGRKTILYNRSDSTAPVAPLPARTPLHRLNCSGQWCRVRTDDGRTGYVPSSSISNVWIRISKADRRLYFYRGPQLVDVYNIDVGYNTFADKKRRGSLQQRDHWRTPEGTFYVVDKKPRSEFYKALVLNYPTSADAERGLQQGLISRSEHEAIVQAQEQFRMPPMNTELGGWIEIHGEGTGGSTNWTQGCVAVENQVMNQIWTEVGVGTPVLIE